MAAVGNHRAISTPGSTALSESQLRRALTEDPNSFEAAFWLGVLLRNSGDGAQAIGFAQRAIELNPSDAAAHGSLASCFSLLNKPEQAIASFDRAIELDPNCCPFWHNRGNDLERLGRFDEAIASYRSAIKVDPNSPYSFVTLGRLLGERKQPKEAELCFRRAEAITSNEPQPLLDLARSFYDEGIADEAANCLQRAIELDSESAEAHALLGTVLMQLGRFEEARSVLERTIALNPRIAQPYIDLVGSRKTSAEHRPLLERMAGMLRERGLTTEERRNLHYALGKAFDDLGDYRTAIRHFDEANGMMMIQLSAHPFDRATHTAGLNQMIEVFSEKLLSMPRNFGVDSDKPILIVGMIRSGTTLVEQILSSHPDVAAGGELSYLIQRYSEVMTPLDGMSRGQAAVEFASGYLALLQNLGGDKPRVTDKMPNNYFLLGLIHTVFPNARIVHCRRNPADTCTSIYTTPFSRPLSFAHDPETIVFYYKEYQRIMDNWRRVLPPDRLLEVDYEELISNPEPESRRLIEFCGLEWSDSCLHHYRNTGAIRTPSWWQARQPIYRTSIGRYENYKSWLPAFREFS